MKIGDKIIELRSKRGWSQSQLADRSGLPQTTISNIEKIGTDPNSKTLRKLAIALNVSADELLSLEVKN